MFIGNIPGVDKRAPSLKSIFNHLIDGVLYVGVSTLYIVQYNIIIVSSSSL